MKQKFRRIRFVLKHGLLLAFCLAYLGLMARAWVLRPRVALQAMAPQEVFAAPTHLTEMPGEPRRFVVTEKAGRVKWLYPESERAEGVLLDLSTAVSSESWEDGMLSTAFDPEFSKNRHFYVFYCLDKPLRNRISRFTLKDDLTADPATELVILEYKKHDNGHNAGHIQFGPDGYLWATIGEAGAMRHKHYEDLKGKSVLGSLIRIDVRGATKQTPYRIPEDNPFAGNNRGVRSEIWAHGLRNPWRFAFHPETGQPIVADVGDLHREEVNFIEKGKHYGWPVWEGDICYPPGTADCPREGYAGPALNFGKGIIRSITGGVVYRGDALPELRGKYIFGDYLRGIFAIAPKPVDRLMNSMLVPELELLAFKLPAQYGPKRGRETNSIVSFFEDSRREVYAVDLMGTVYKIVPLGGWAAVSGFLYQMLTFR